MKSLIWALFVLTGCTGSCIATHDGVIEGQLVDVHWGGVVLNSCEIVIQYGEGASKVDQTSSREKKVCDELKAAIGHKVKIAYTTYAFGGLGVKTDDLVQSYQVIQ